jgi:hypothetical protein
MKLIIILILSLNLFSYVGKIDPYKKITLKSEAVGKVSYINNASNFTFAKKNIILKINSDEDLIRLESLQKKLEATKEIYEISKYTFDSKKSIKSLSKNEKNREKLNMLIKKQNYISLSENLNIQLSKINKKTFIVKNKYIGKIYPNVDEFVSVGSKIADIYDISKKKIVIFVNKEDIDKINKKDIFINNKPSKFFIESISNVVDSKYISSYQVVLLENNNNVSFRFGDIVQIDFK